MKRLLATALIVAPAAAWAHTAPTGWSYGSWCCNEKDCAVIDLDHVDVTQHGYRVVLEPGDHPSITRRLERLFRFNDGIADTDDMDPPEARRSGDSNYHACVSKVSQYIRCLYVPDGGV